MNAEVAEPKCHMLPRQDQGKWTFLRLAVFLDDIKAAKLLMASGSDPSRFCGMEFRLEQSSFYPNSFGMPQYIRFKEMPNKLANQCCETLASHLAYGILVGTSNELIMLMADFGADP